MTTNAIVQTTVGDWVNIHAGAGLAAGTALTMQVKSRFPVNVVFVDSAAKPTGTVDTAGGIETGKPFEVVNSSPAAGEFTWARLRDDNGTDTVDISVQD